MARQMTTAREQTAEPGMPDVDERPPAVGWGAAVQAALPLWLASRVAVAVAAMGGIWTLRPVTGREIPGFLDIWEVWDAALFRKVAEFGYYSQEYADQTAVDFPGLPLLMRAVHLVVGDWTAAALIVSLVGGAAAAVGLWRLAAQETGPLGGTRAVMYLVAFPYAVFLFVGYSEALFLGFAIPAWYVASRGDWRAAGLLTAGAAFTRVTGLGLAVALGVEYLVQHQRARRAAGEPTWTLRGLVDRHCLWLLAPLASAGSYVVYLWARTGRWDAYSEAQRIGWGRDFPVSPVQAFQTSFAQATNLDQAAGFVWAWRTEVTVVVLGVVLALVLVASRRFGEATFVGLNVSLLALSSYYASGARAALIWFPLYTLLARLTWQRDWLHLAVLAVTAPLAIVFTVTFVQGGWLG